MVTMMGFRKYAVFFARYAIALSFLSAVADRFGMWGESGQQGVFWGNFQSFLDYTAILNPWAPRVLSDILGYTATGLEIVFAGMLVFGFKIKEASLGSSLLLLLFALSMAVFLGTKTALDYNVLTASAGSLLIYFLHDHED